MVIKSSVKISLIINATLANTTLSNFTLGVCVCFSDPFFTLKVGELVSPAYNTRFQDAVIQRNEAVYHSKKDQPLGKARDFSNFVPHDFDKLNTTFGRPTEFCRFFRPLDD